MTRISTITPEVVGTFPTRLQPGVLYISLTYSTAVHLCCCGCGQEVITPLSPIQWVLTFDGAVTLRPSIGNGALPCRSHYFIDHGTVRWTRPYTPAETRRDRDDDRRLLAETHAETVGWIGRAVQRLHSLTRRNKHPHA